MSTSLRLDDPAYWMLEQGRKDPSKRSVRTAPKREGCYICEDPEFALMGLPLCFACPKCKGHVPADDTVCSDCGHDGQPMGVDDEGEVVLGSCVCRTCKDASVVPLTKWPVGPT